MRTVAYAGLCIASGSIAPLLFAATASIADCVDMCASRDNTKLCHMQFIVGFNSMRSIQFNSFRLKETIAKEKRRKTLH